MGKINFLNIPIDAMTMQETLNSIDNAITLNKQIVHSAINAGKIVVMQTDKNLEKSVLNSDLINADGQSIVWAVSFLMGVGGSFDVIAGHKMRAPRLLQNIGCEWLWRFALEPIRLFKRYTIGILKFISLVINERMKQI